MFAFQFTGDAAWRAEAAGSAVEAAPLVSADGRTVYFGSAAPAASVYALDAAQHACMPTPLPSSSGGMAARTAGTRSTPRWDSAIVRNLYLC